MKYLLDSQARDKRLILTLIRIRRRWEQLLAEIVCVINETIGVFENVLSTVDRDASPLQKRTVTHPLIDLEFMRCS